MPEQEEIRRTIRAEKLKLREALAVEERVQASQKIADKVLSLVHTSNWSTIHSYLSFRSEVHTQDLIASLLASGRTIIVPWVEADGELSHHELLGLDSLSEGPYGLPHPVRNEYSFLNRIEAVLLPLSAFDRKGNRLGYGKGFYDRFLARLSRNTIRIGLAFALQEAADIPAMDHDQKLDMIITERETISTRVTQ